MPNVFGRGEECSFLPSRGPTSAVNGAARARRRTETICSTPLIHAPLVITSLIGKHTWLRVLVIHHSEAIRVGILGDQFTVLVDLYSGLRTVRLRRSAHRETRVRCDVPLVGLGPDYLLVDEPVEAVV